LLFDERDEAAEGEDEGSVEAVDPTLYDDDSVDVAVVPDVPITVLELGDVRDSGGPAAQIYEPGLV